MYPVENDRLTLLRAVECARNGIVLTDPGLPDNPIVYANPAFIELTGYEMDEILGKNCRFLQGEDRQQENTALIKDAIANQKAITAVIRNYRKNGSLFYNELTVSPVHDSSGKLVNFIGVQNDVTARLELEKRMSDFYSMISHELRTPISSINASLLALEDGSVSKLNAPGKKLVNIALSNCKRLIGLINNILDWKKLQAGKFKISIQSWDPQEVLDTVIQNFEPVAAMKKIVLEKEIISSSNVVFDPERITDVLSNLVSNAIKYSEPESKILIKIDCPASEKYAVKFFVCDQGPGIEPEFQDKLFVQFQQLDSSDRRPKNGTGLGLSISKSIVELHKGEIGVESKPGKGSTFWFTIPCLVSPD